jgi:hypothetical protein
MPGGRRKSGFQSGLYCRQAGGMEVRARMEKNVAVVMEPRGLALAVPGQATSGTLQGTRLDGRDVSGKGLRRHE